MHSRVDCPNERLLHITPSKDASLTSSEYRLIKKITTKLIKLKIGTFAALLIKIICKHFCCYKQQLHCITVVTTYDKN